MKKRRNATRGTRAGNSNRAPRFESLQPRELMTASTADVDQDGTIQDIGYFSMFELARQDVQPRAEASGSRARISEPYAPPAAGSDAEASFVYTPDGRSRVTDTDSYWASAVGRLWVQFPDGQQSSCSGAMIQQNHFVTAGHCIYSQDHGGFAERGTVSLGQQGAALPGDGVFRRSQYQPFGEAQVTGLRTAREWTDHQDFRFDLALVTLDRNIGFTTGWLGYGHQPDDRFYVGNLFNTAGYPGDLNDHDGDGRMDHHEMYHVADAITEVDDHILKSDRIDVFAGQSGSPLWAHFQDDSRIVYGVASHEYFMGLAPNGFTRITQPWFDGITEWIQEDQAQRPASDLPDLTDFHDWFATDASSISTSEVRPGERFSVSTMVRNNGTAPSRPVQVSFYASDDDRVTDTDHLIGSITIPEIAPFGFADAILDTAFPEIPEGTYRIGWRIDDSDLQPEFVEDNNAFVLTDSRLIVDGTADPQTGEIRGRVWDDVDRDGRIDQGERGLPARTVYLDLNQNGQLDQDDRSIVTDSTGRYAFSDLVAGTYVVTQVLQGDDEQTSPAMSSTVATSPGAEGQVEAITSSRSTELAWAMGEEANVGIGPMTSESSSLINLDRMRADDRFRDVDGRGSAVVVLDTGIDLDHPYFGPDSDGDGVADRIVHYQDFTNSPTGPEDAHGHGTNVSSIVGSQNPTHKGMAPGVDIIHLKVLGDDGSGTFDGIERALQWIADHSRTYNVVSVNMSLGAGNYQQAQTQQAISDELAALAAMDVVVVSAAGNGFFELGSQTGVAYPAADANSLAVGAVWDADIGTPAFWGSGAIDYSTGPDRLISFSQREPRLTDIFAPGALIAGAVPGGGAQSYGGTSQASPHIAGIAALAQQISVDRLGRRLTFDEFRELLRTTSVTIHDGDDEQTNVLATDESYARVDVYALADEIWNMRTDGVDPPVGTHVVSVGPGDVVTDVDFGVKAADGPTDPTNGPSQIVRGSRSHIAAGPGQPFQVQATYEASDGETSLSGLSLRLHYDSSAVAFVGLTDVLGTGLGPQQVSDDVDNLDGDSDTDKYVNVLWFDITGNWPGQAGLLDLYTAGFEVRDELSDGDMTTLRFTGNGAASHGFVAEPIEVTVGQSASLDVDGNGVADPLTDGILITRYLAGFRGGALVDGAIDSRGELSDPQEIVAHLDSVRDIMLDVDGNGSADPLTDGLLTIRYLAGFRGASLTDGAVDSSGTRNTADQIENFLDQFTMSLASQGPAADPSSVLGSEQHVGLSTHEILTSGVTNIEFDLSYSTLPRVEPTTGLALRLHYDSSQLEFAGMDNLLSEGLSAYQVARDTEDLDGDEHTDEYVNLLWFDLLAQWPEMERETRLLTAHFTTTKELTSETDVRLTGRPAAGYTLSSEALRVRHDATPEYQPGDANRDGVFDSSDIVAVWRAGKFDKDEFATWEEGDWDGDERFTTRDLILAWKEGNYHAAGARRVSSSHVSSAVDAALAQRGAASWGDDQDDLGTAGRKARSAAERLADRAILSLDLEDLGRFLP